MNIKSQNELLFLAEIGHTFAQSMASINSTAIHWGIVYWLININTAAIVRVFLKRIKIYKKDNKF